MNSKNDPNQKYKQRYLRVSGKSLCTESASPYEPVVVVDNEIGKRFESPSREILTRLPQAELSLKII